MKNTLKDLKTLSLEGSRSQGLLDFASFRSSWDLHLGDACLELGQPQEMMNGEDVFVC